MEIYNSVSTTAGNSWAKAEASTCADVGQSYVTWLKLPLPCYNRYTYTEGKHMTREDFLSNVRDYIEFQSGAGISALEWVIRYVFDLDSRPDIIFACNQMLIGDSEPDVEAALNSQLPAVLSQALSTI
jgi:hypothetical protein